jgi:hypothetical protein
MSKTKEIPRLFQVGEVPGGEKWRGRRRRKPDADAS